MSFFGLPSFPLSSIPTALPTISSTPAKPAAQVVETPKTQTVFTLNNLKIQFSPNDNPDNSKRDKEGSIIFLTNGPSIEMTIKGEKQNISIKKSKITYDDTTTTLTTPNGSIKIWQTDQAMLNKLLAFYYIVKHSKKSKYPLAVKPGVGFNIGERDKFTVKVSRWVFEYPSKFEEQESLQEFTNENIPANYKSIILGSTAQNKVVALSSNEFVLIDIITAEQFIKRINAINVVDRLAALEDNADLLIAQAEKYVKHVRMQKALEKLKKKSQELDRKINANAIELLELKNAAAEGKEKLDEAKLKLERCTADEKIDEAAVSKERAAMIATMNGIDVNGDELELEMLSQDGAKQRFAECVLSVFKAMCADLGSSGDFSADALKERLDQSTSLIMESLLI